ncbi:MAG: hypothetical protein JXQ73_34015 [Phycisphaerae bacterium]|nr:hypothetical protein [Phycisphaerae bacterium]
MGSRTQSLAGVFLVLICAGLMLSWGCTPPPTGGTDPNATGGTDPNTTGGTDPNTTGGTDPNTTGGTTTPSGLATIDLNVVKLDVEATTQRGPAVGDGVLAFDAAGGAVLAWVKAGSTTANEVQAPAGMTHDRSAFKFAGKNLVVRDRFSGALYVFDTDAEVSKAISDDSIDMGGSGGPDLWEADGDLVATFNSWVTTQDGAHKYVKVADVGNVNAITVTPFDVDPDNTTGLAIALDAAGGKIVVHTSDGLYVYTIATPNAAPQKFTRSALNGGLGMSDIVIDGNYVAFFDDNEDYTVLNISTGQFSQPSRNPGRQNRGLALQASRLGYFALQTNDDGYSTSVINRCMVGRVTSLNSLYDPSGAFVNGSDENDGRLGFGATVAISPNARFVFVAGETAVGVDEQERLYLSMDGGYFECVLDDDDPDDVLRAAGVACSNNLVAFLIPATLSGTTSDVSVGYAVLPPK